MIVLLLLLLLDADADARTAHIRRSDTSLLIKYHNELMSSLTLGLGAHAGRINKALASYTCTDMHAVRHVYTYIYRLHISWSYRNQRAKTVVYKNVRDSGAHTRQDDAHTHTDIYLLALAQERERERWLPGCWLPGMMSINC